ncbi:MAG: hypothetical protein GON13_01080 [Nanoarchaeota archaeon]|nr:hypothetical protein [Nanoarchaeota archaeon]
MTLIAHFLYKTNNENKTLEDELIKIGNKNLSYALTNKFVDIIETETPTYDGIITIKYDEPFEDQQKKVSYIADQLRQMENITHTFTLMHVLEN